MMPICFRNQLLPVAARLIGTCALTLLLAVLLSVQPAAAQDITAPDGFVAETLYGGFDLPTDFAFARDGRIFVAEKAGRVRVIQNGRVLPEPFIDLTGVTNSMFDRGLLGIALHPDFPATPYVYLAHVYEPPAAAGYKLTGARTARVIRVTANSGNTSTAQPGSLKVLVGAGGTFDQIGNPDQHDVRPWTCETAEPERTPAPDCMPAEGMAHTIGTLLFGPDGMLYIGNGDGVVETSGSMRAQTLDSLAGKILRVDPRTGAGLPDNPYFDGDPESNRAKVFLSGMRNPFRFVFWPGTNKLIVADVGDNSWEEVNVAQAGDNLGWPCFEGPMKTGIGITCNGLYTGGARLEPVYSYPHADGRGAAIGGAFYDGDTFPAEYRDAFFYADFNAGTLDVLRFGADGAATSAVFAKHAPAPVRMQVGPDGNLYVLYIASGTLGRIRSPDSGGASKPILAGEGEPQADTENSPQVTIVSPAPDGHYPVGASVELAGMAVDGEGAAIPDAQLRWEGVLHHKEHVHYDYYHQDGAVGTLAIENHGENTHLELCLIAVADNGAEGRACVDLYPGGVEDEHAEHDEHETFASSTTAGPVESQGILREYWTGVAGNTITDLLEHGDYPDRPTGTEVLPRLEAPAVFGADYGQVLRGYLLPPETGDYQFWIAADDAGELWLSTDATPENLRLIAYTPDWTRQREWARYPEQASALLRLAAGKRYYLEVRHKEADQKDNLAVAWQVPGGERTVIEGRYLAPSEP